MRFHLGTARRWFDCIGKLLGFLGLDFTCVVNKVLTLNRVLKKLAASFSHLQFSWWWLETLGLQAALVFYCSRQGGCQVAGCSTILFSVEASSLLQMQNETYPEGFPKSFGPWLSQRSAVVSVQCCFQWIL